MHPLLCHINFFCQCGHSESELSCSFVRCYGKVQDHRSQCYQFQIETHTLNIVLCGIYSASMTKTLIARLNLSSLKVSMVAH